MWGQVDDDGRRVEMKGSMYRYVSVAEMVAIEKEADAAGISYAQMMENAGQALAEVVSAATRQLRTKSVLGLVGSGNNGGDTLVALSRLAQDGWQAYAYMVGGRKGSNPLVERLQQAGGLLFQEQQDEGHSKLTELVSGQRVLLDGLLGTGITLPLRPPLPQVLAAVQAAVDKADPRPLMVAVDVPSGVDADNGQAADETLKADVTVCMAAVKSGLLALPAFKYIGHLQLVDIGLPPDFEAMQAIRRFVADQSFTQAHLPPRPLDSHKGTFGTALIIAGSMNFPGAALLAGRAAYRCGTGLVTMALPRTLQTALAGQLPEATWLPLPEEQGALAVQAAEMVLENLHRVSALLLGPGFGLRQCSQQFIERLLQAEQLPPLVVDADGLKLLANIKDWQDKLPPGSILTPHPGEMAQLTGLATSDIQAQRVEVAERFAQQWGQVVILKGAFTVIASPEGDTALLPVATAALARAGTGDVLAGLVVGLRAQGMPAFPASVAAAWIHAQAGLAAARRLESTAGVLAGDLVRHIPGLMEAENKSIHTYKDRRKRKNV